MFRITLCVLMLASLLYGCEEKAEQPVEAEFSAPNSVATLLMETVEVVLVETPAEAIPTWRQQAQAKPALLLMAPNPLLQSIPATIKEATKTLIQNGNIEDFKTKTSPTAVSPTMLPNMALSASLDAGYFSEVYWVLPASAGTVISLEAFLEKLLELGDISDEEAATFTGEDDRFKGEIRGVPFTILLKSSIPTIDSTTVLHLDLGFLAADYQNEIRTPLYKHADEMLSQLKQAEIKVHAVTISASNISGDVSLRTRFLGEHIRSRIAEPQKLESPLESNAALRNDSLYLSNFFKKEEILVNAKKMVENNPEDASARYDLYQILRQFNESAQALEQLEKAATIDSVYAMEYLDLADTALEKNRPEAALSMLKKAAVFFPDNHFLDIGQADIMIHTGHSKEALELLSTLKSLSWSTTYHKHIPRYLDDMIEVAKGQRNTTETKAKPGRILHSRHDTDKEHDNK